MMHQSNITAILALLANVDRMTPDRFNSDLSALYRFETEIGGLTRKDVLDLIACGSQADRKIGVFMVIEEVMAYSAYLRIMHRRRAVTSRLLEALQTEDEPEVKPVEVKAVEVTHG